MIHKDPIIVYKLFKIQPHMNMNSYKYLTSKSYGIFLSSIKKWYFDIFYRADRLFFVHKPVYIIFLNIVSIIIKIIAKKTFKSVFIEDFCYYFNKYGLIYTISSIKMCRIKYSTSLMMLYLKKYIHRFKAG